MSAFKKRNGFSCPRADDKRRPDVDPERCAVWQREIEPLLATVDNESTFNGDETSWHLSPNGVTTWAPRVADGVTVGIKGGDKECLTVMASIHANGRKDPLDILAHGRTIRVEETQIGEVGDHMWDHSTSGWMTPDVFGRSLEFIRGLAENQEATLHLLLDIYDLHIQAAAQNRAKSRNIQINTSRWTDEDLVVLHLRQTTFREACHSRSRITDREARGNPDLVEMLGALEHGRSHFGVGNLSQSAG